MVSENALNDTGVKKFIRNKNQKFDLVLADHMLQDSLFIFAKKFNCPIITLGIDGYTSSMDEAMGISTPYTLIPHPITKYDTKMSYMQRCYNALLYMYEGAVRKFSYLPAQNKLVKKYFKEAFPDGKIPDVSEAQISAILVNSHRNYIARPKLVTQVEIAGAHISKPSRAIPQDLQEIYETAKEVIYFSLGSYSPSAMPKEKIDAIVKALTETNRLVFMQYDDDFVKPSNIVLRQYFPQNDILAKSKVKLFITNGECLKFTCSLFKNLISVGGTLSYQEAVKNRVPMIIIPFTGEQYRNGLRAEKDKIGTMILFDDLNVDLLKNKIDAILKDGATYYQNLKNVAEDFNSNPVEPMKEAMFWIENVIKNQGAARLDSSHLSSLQRCGFDVAAFYIGLVLIFITFWTVLITIIVRRHRQKQEKGKFKYY